MTVTFSSPVEVNRLVLGVNSTTTSTSTLTLTGVATTADFNVTDGLEVLTGLTGRATYDGATGIFTAASNDQSLMIGSTSNNTITSFTLSAGASGGGGDGYTVFFGVAPLAVPEPSTFALVGAGVLCFAGVRGCRRWRRGITSVR